jgi:hypothetical protein
MKMEQTTDKPNKKFTIAITLFMNTVMCVFMALTALLVNVGYITPVMFLVTFLEAMIICNLATVIFRIPKFSAIVAMKLAKGKIDSKVFKIFNGLLQATINTLILNTCMTLINVGFAPIYWLAWLRGFPALEIVAIAASFAFTPIAVKFALAVAKPKVQK